MGHKVNLAAFAALPVAFCLLLGAAPYSVASLPGSSSPAPEAMESRTATVRAVDVKARTLAVLTGVGHAVRLLRIPLSPECQIKVAGTAAELKDLKPGDIVRMTYRKSEDRSVAVRIETVPVQEAGEKR